MSKPNDDDDLSEFFDVMHKLAGHLKETKGSDKPKKKKKRRVTREIDDELIAELLTSKHSGERVKGRLLATALNDEVVKFTVHECERETPLAEVLVALTQVAATQVGTLIVNNANSSEVAVRIARMVSVVFGDYLRALLELNPSDP